MRRQLLLRFVWPTVCQVCTWIITNERKPRTLCMLFLARTFTRIFFSFFLFCVMTNTHSLAQPSRYVGRKPHRYTFSSATNNVHNSDVSPDQVKVYLNSGGHTKGNGTGPGVTYNKVYCHFWNLLLIYLFKYFYRYWTVFSTTRIFLPRKYFSDVMCTCNSFDILASTFVTHQMSFC